MSKHFPEAIPLRRHTAVDVAHALAEIFSRYSFSKEMLTDMGREFMSCVMECFSKACAVKQIKTSAFHPSCNGQCERMNGIIKRLITSVTEQFAEDWDKCLPWVLMS